MTGPYGLSSTLFEVRVTSVGVDKALPERNSSVIWIESERELGKWDDPSRRVPSVSVGVHARWCLRLKDTESSVGG